MHRLKRIVWGGVDVGVLVGAIWLAREGWLRWKKPIHGLEPPLLELLSINGWMPAAGLLIAGWLILLRQQGYYDPVRTYTAVQSVGHLTRVVCGVLLLAISIEFFLPHAYFSRSLILLFLLFGFVGLSVVRWVEMRFLFRWYAPRESWRVLVIGAGTDAQIFGERLARDGRGFYQVVGFLEHDDQVPVVSPERRLGRIDDLRSIVNNQGIATVVLADRRLPANRMMEIATHCDRMGVEVLQVPLTWGGATPGIGLGRMGDLQLVDLTAMSYPSLATLYKRVFDLLVVSVVVVLLFPVLLVTALAVLVDGGGPLLYVSERVGRGGRSFPFFKFRSMRVGAEQERAGLEARNEADGVLFKIRDDPRLTGVGRFLRRWSLDELPQIWNVIRGDMNLVGPRPLPVGDLEGLEHDPEMAYWFDLRHHVSPGITGLWQVRGRVELGFDEMVRLDLYYVQNWSPWLDLKVLLLTMPAILRGRGAA